MVTPTGVNNTPVISDAGSLHGGDANNAIGYLKIAPNGQQLALANTYGQNFVELFDFDDTTGVISNPILLNTIFFQNDEGPYGIEFSPNSQILYVSDISFNLNQARIHQFDITLSNATDILNSDTILFDGNILMGALQLAIDQKIYVTVGGTNFLDVIENPDVLGVGAVYTSNAVDLGSAFATFGLPPFIQSFFNVGITTQNVCLGTTATFSVNSNDVIDSILWDFGDGTTSTLENPTHDYLTTGVFNVNVNVVSGANSVDLARTITVSEVPIANPMSDYLLCDDITNDDVEVFDLSTKNLEIIGAQSNTQFEVSYFLNQTDADNDENEIALSYSNITNSQEIFARIYNVDNHDCYATTSFNLIVSQLPTANIVTDIVLCDDVSEDGVEELNLSQLNTQVLNGQTASDFNITYHVTQADADAGNGDLPNNFETISNPQSIFVRIENASNINCFNTSTFTITVDDYFAPNQPNDLFLCDDAFNDQVEFFDLSQQTAQITNGLPGTYNVTYHISQEDADDNINELSTNYENSNNPQMIFARIEKTTNIFCYQTLSFFIEVKALPVLDFETTDYICSGEELTLNAGIGFDTYLWSTGETTSSIIVDSGGDYGITVGNNYITNPALSFTVTETITVIESDLAVFESIEILDWTPDNNAIQVFVNGIGDYEYSVDGINYQDSYIFAGLEPGEYTVFVRDKFGCGVVEEAVYLLFYPYFFTPNDDGKNDFWQIKFSDTEPDLDIKIFDRYGKWLTSLNPRDVGWDGTFNGKVLPATDYWFVVTRPSNGRQYKGHFSLRR